MLRRSNDCDALMPSVQQAPHQAFYRIFFLYRLSKVRLLEHFRLTASFPCQSKAVNTFLASCKYREAKLNAECAVLQVELSLASRNVGLPPSSLQSFLRVNSSLQGGLLAEFDAAYINPAFATPHDSLEGIEHPGIASAAELLAQTLHSLASSSGEALQVSLAVLATVVYNLACSTIQVYPYVLMGPP